MTSADSIPSPFTGASGVPGIMSVSRDPQQIEEAMESDQPRSVRLDRGQVYVVCAVVDGALRDPWCFTQYIDAQVKLEEIKIAGERDEKMDIQAAIYKVRVVDQGVEPPPPE